MNIFIRKFSSLKSYHVDQESLILSKFLNFHHGISQRNIERLIRLNRLNIKDKNGVFYRDIEINKELTKGDFVEILHDKKSKKDMNNFSIEYLMHFPFDREKIEQLVLYKDKDILVINKPGNISVQGGTKTNNHIQKFFQHLQFESNEKPRLVHRLDRKTSGLLILARNLESSRLLCEGFKDGSLKYEGGIPLVDSYDAFGEKISESPKIDSLKNIKKSEIEIEKYYYAITTGSVYKESHNIDNFISYIPPELFGKLGSLKDCQVFKNLSQISPKHYKFLKRAVTEFKVIVQDFGGQKGSLLELSPKTGRKRQLRLHCANTLGCPILGDDKHGLAVKHLYKLGWDGLVNLQEYRNNLAHDFPMFLHLRKIVIKNYFGKLNINHINADTKDLTLVAPFPYYWKHLLEELDVNIKTL